MRNNFAEALYEEGKKDNKICVVVADISPAGSIQKFRNEFERRIPSKIGARTTHG